tara:strand:- start:2542 stop:3372 length:831 start_codon:yes stop_codon:yes gene_type:complete
MKGNNKDYTKSNFKGRRFVMADVHGGYLAMKDALEKANFDYENDLLIQTGDVTDGWHQTKECIDELLKIKNLVYLLGNHDSWSLDYYDGKMGSPYGVIKAESAWYTQGGKETIGSLGEHSEQDPKYLEFLKTGLLCYRIVENGETLIFAHANIPSAGFDLEKMIEQGNSYEFIWDRSLIQQAAHKRNNHKTVDKRFKEIYLGHSCVGYLMPEDEHQYKPQKMTNVWAMDTNAAYDGKISIMDIDTKELFQSDFVCKYYPDDRGRNSESYNEHLENN